MIKYDTDNQTARHAWGQRDADITRLEDLVDCGMTEQELHSLMYDDDDDEDEEDDIGLVMLRYMNGEIGTFEEELAKLRKKFGLDQYSLSYSTDGTVDDSYLSTERRWYDDVE